MKNRINWKNIFSRLPLPMLAIAASYGVYQFASLYVPWWVALAQAAAFELVYISLAIQENLPDKLRKRATAISLGAVAVSILYNSISGYLHRNDLLLDGTWRVAFEIIMAVLHGAPLAGLAYLVSNLLLHTESEPMPELDVTAIVEAERTKYQILLEDKDRERDQLYQNYQRELGKLQLALIEASKPKALEESTELTKRQQIAKLRETMTLQEVAQHFNVSPRTVQNWAKGD